MSMSLCDSVIVCSIQVDSMDALQAALEPGCTGQPRHTVVWYVGWCVVVFVVLQHQQTNVVCSRVMPQTLKGTAQHSSPGWSALSCNCRGKSMQVNSSVQVDTRLDQEVGTHGALGGVGVLLLLGVQENKQDAVGRV